MTKYEYCKKMSDIALKLAVHFKKSKDYDLARFYQTNILQFEERAEALTLEEASAQCSEEELKTINNYRLILEGVENAVE